jgi:hypothetical protein
LFIPESFPIKYLSFNHSLIETQMEHKFNISELKLKKWLLIIKKLLTSFNVSIVDGLLQWKNNLDKEFEGIEVCSVS